MRSSIAFLQISAFSIACSQEIYKAFTAFEPTALSRRASNRESTKTACLYCSKSKGLFLSRGYVLFSQDGLLTYTLDESALKGAGIVPLSAADNKEAVCSIIAYLHPQSGTYTWKLGPPFQQGTESTDAFAVWESMPGTCGGLVIEVSGNGAIARRAVHAAVFEGGTMDGHYVGIQLNQRLEHCLVNYNNII